MNSKAIVTLANDKYFSLLQELIASIKSFKESESVSICVLDAGLTEQQVKILKNQIYSIKKAEWDIKVPTYKVMGKEIIIDSIPYQANTTKIIEQIQEQIYLKKNIVL